jgi:hypothetical protein
MESSLMMGARFFGELARHILFVTPANCPRQIVLCDLMRFGSINIIDRTVGQ